MNSANIVGLGSVTGYGVGVSAMTDGLLAGESSVRRQPAPDGVLPANSWYARVPLEDDQETKLSRFAVGFETAVDEAVSDALSRGWSPGSNVAIVHGSARGDMVRMKALLDRTDDHIRRTYISSLPSTPLSVAAQKYDIHGPLLTVNGTCASGLFALALGQRLLACDDATDVIVCGTEIGCPAAIFEGLEKLGVLFTDRPPFEATRPLSDLSMGFVAGEGAAAVVLTKEHDDKRYMKVASSVLANDGYHAISVDPAHEQINRALDHVLERSGVARATVRTYVSHGTGTRQCNDADRFALGHLPRVVRVLAAKPWFGHCRGAASLLETIVVSIGAQSTEVGNTILGRIQPPELDLPDAKGILFPGLHMSLGAGGNIAMAIYEQ